MLVNMPEFKEYIRIEDITENVEDSIDIYSIIHNTNEFKQSSIEIASVTKFDFLQLFQKVNQLFLTLHSGAERCIRFR